MGHAKQIRLTARVKWSLHEHRICQAWLELEAGRLGRVEILLEGMEEQRGKEG